MTVDPFEWDDAKSERNFRERGIDFEYACRVFEGDVLERDDTRRNYGERRLIAVGEVDGETLTVVYTWRGETRRIISVRRADRRERHAYREAFGSANS